MILRHILVIECHFWASETNIKWFGVLDRKLLLPAEENCAPQSKFTTVLIKTENIFLILHYVISF